MTATLNTIAALAFFVSLIIIVVDALMRLWKKSELPEFLESTDGGYIIG